MGRPVPTPSQLQWHRDELAMFLHFGVNTFTDREWGDGTESPSIFNPSSLDAMQWGRAAKRAGFKAMILTADTANHYVLSLQRPDWEVRFDMDKGQAAATRRKVFDMIATDKLAFIGYHMPFPAAGFVEKSGEGYRFVPVSYQFDI